MARFCPLASGSSGNSTYVGAAEGGLLIDAGISARSIAKALAGRGIEPRQIKAVLVTHEHTDHVKGLMRLVQLTGAQVFASGPVLEWLGEREMLPPGARTALAEGEFWVGDIRVEAFETPHDSVGSRGYRLEMPDGRTVGVATDLGHATEEVEQALTGCDLVLLEANYDQRMLMEGRYPYYIKSRIRSERGHLENEESASLLARLLQKGSSRFVLGHLSQENNTPQRAFEAILRRLEAAGGRLGRDFTLAVAPRGEAAELLRF